MVYQYSRSVLGGTFDHFHKGHKELLLAAFAKSSSVVIGLVENSFVKDKSFSSSIEDYSTRKSALHNFLVTQNLSSRAEIIPINDIYGTTLVDPSFQAIIVTEETENNAKKINCERERLNLPPLTIELVPYIYASDREIISSRRIREGLIDKDGFSYLKLFKTNSSYQLPHILRSQLQSPIGTIVKEISKLKTIIKPNSSIIAVGDIVTHKLLESFFLPSICIVDYRTRRSDIKDFQFPPSSFHLPNPAGTVNPQIGSILRSALSASQQTKPQIIEVQGEEDLLALPAILLAPLGSYVIYGQYNLGMVVVVVTEQTKAIVHSLLKQF